MQFFPWFINIERKWVGLSKYKGWITPFIIKQGEELKKLFLFFFIFTKYTTRASPKGIPRGIYRVCTCYIVLFFQLAEDVL